MGKPDMVGKATLGDRLAGILASPAPAEARLLHTAPSPALLHRFTFSRPGSGELTPSGSFLASVARHVQRLYSWFTRRAAVVGSHRLAWEYMGRSSSGPRRSAPK